MFWEGLLVGMFIGSAGTILGIALCNIGKRGDNNGNN